jgi:hypothetical protein
MPNGDIITGCSDGNVRIYSAAEERWASEEDLRKYDELISMQAISSYVHFRSYCLYAHDGAASKSEM